VSDVDVESAVSVAETTRCEWW